MNTSTTLDRRSPRARAVVLTGAAAGIALTLAAPLAASAHVHVDPGSVSAGATSTLTFASSHGCDGSPTTAFVIDIPDGAGNATPIVQGGWTITRELGADGVPARVTFTADTPVEDGLKAEFAMDVLFDESAAGTTVAFPVTQLCAAGENAWIEIAEDGEDPHDLESPAPVVAVGDADTDAEDGDHAHAAGAADADTAAATAGATADPVARWLAAGALAAGVAALVVALVRGRARKA